MIRILVPLAMLASGLGAGGLMISVLGGAPLLLSLPTEVYVPVHMFLVKRFDPFMPACLLTTLVADLATAAVAGSWPARVLAVLAAACALTTTTISLRKNVPINKWVAGLDPDRLPENWAEVDPRVRWSTWNSVRTGFACAALACNAGLAGVLL